jgi:copper chaperone CopZ
VLDVLVFIAKEGLGMSETILRVPDMSCGHCVAAVQRALEGVEGVESAQVSLDSKIARITHIDGLDLGALLGAVQAAGYTPEPEG